MSLFRCLTLYGHGWLWLLWWLVFSVCATPSAATAQSITYLYDELGRLRAVVDPSQGTAVFIYDAVGNILSIQRFASSAVQLIDFSPKTGATGTEVTILGTGFGATLGQNTVTFNGTQATVTSASPTQLIATVPAGATTGPISVTAPGGPTTSSIPFTVGSTSGAPTIVSVTPGIATAGSSITLTGTNFDPLPAHDRLFFNQIRLGQTTSATATSLTATVPQQVGSGHLTLTTPGGTVTTSSDLFVPPPPYVATDVQATARLAPTVPQTITISTPGKIALAVVDGVAGQGFQLGVSAISFPADIRIYNPDGTELTSAYASIGTQGGFVRAFGLPTTGSYSVLVDPNGNSTGSATLTVGASDLIVTSVTPPSTPISPGAGGTYQFIVTWTGKNQGNVSPPSTVNWNDRLYLSLRPTLDTTAIAVGNRYNNDIQLPAPGQTYTVSAWATLPAVTPGTYYILVEADWPGPGVVPEGNEANNVTASPPITLLPAGSGPSLTVSATTVSPGDSMTVTLANGAGGSTDWLALTPVGSPDTSARNLQWTYVGAGVTTRPWTVTMPATPGQYEFRYFINDGYTRAATSPAVTVSPTNPTPTITSVSPATVEVGSTALSLTVTGGNFVNGTTATVGGQARTVTFGSPSQVTIALLASDVASQGTVAILVTNPGPCTGGVCASNTVNLGVTAPSPASLAVTYNGLLRDRVGQASLALAADGALDGTVTVTLTASGGRTVTYLRLDSYNLSGTWIGAWDTASTVYWALGAALSLDGALLNNSGNKSVNFTVANGGSFVLFASDLNASEFVTGNTLTVTATFSDGATVSGTLTIGSGAPVPTLASINPSTVSAGGAAFTLTATGTNFTATSVVQVDGNARATTYVSATQLTATIPASDIATPGTLNVTVRTPAPGGGTSSPQSLTVTGSTPTLAVTYNGLLRDRVGQAPLALAADGALDGTVTVTLTASGGRTVTYLRLDSYNPSGTWIGAWDTASTVYWALGAALTLDGALLNNPGNKSVNFTVANGGSFVLFASDLNASEFLTGNTLTVTATFSDGTTVTGTTTVASSGPTLAVGFNGLLRDRVGQGALALGADGVLDGTLTVTLAASGGRTVTYLRLDSYNPSGTWIGAWDTASTYYWALGAALSLDAALLNNPGNKSVSFTVANGGSFLLFASDLNASEFLTGNTLTVTATFSDGVTVTKTISLP